MSTVTMQAVTPKYHPIDVSTVKQWLEQGRAILVDVREPAEHRGLRIDGAELRPLSSFDPSQLPDASGKKLVLHCKAGSRSRQACDKARDALGADVDLFYLDGGIEAWSAAGFPTLADASAPIDLQRQVQLTVGAGVALGTALGAFVNPWFLIIPAFFGCGLTFAGATGTCGLALILARMPWNR